MLGLPFAANSFDLAYCESVLCFIEDKTQAIAELVRVTRPGGYVGISEAFWTSMPSAALAVQMQTILGTRQPLPTRPEWQALWAGSGLAEQDARFHPVESRREVADRIAWVGRSWLLRAIGRGLQLYLTDPVLRRTVQTQIRFPIQGLDQLSYGIFVGRKAA